MVAELGDVPLIGFAGAPFTLASYLVEGGPSRDYAKTKTMMLADPVLWHELCTRLADISAAFLEVQIRGRCRGGPALRFLGRLAQWLTTPASRSPIRAGFSSDCRRPACPAFTSGSVPVNCWV